MKSGIGILLANLGTPEAPTTGAIRTYLRQFLWDRRVVDLPRWLWGPILYGFVLPFRPKRVAHSYAKIWTAEGSPLLVHSSRLRHGLERAFGGGNDRDVSIALGMRYGEPSIAKALEELKAQPRILVLPLFPQYSTSTTASTGDAVRQVLSGWHQTKELRMVESYFDHPAYLEALAASVRRHWSEHGRSKRLLLSFHGVPKRYVQRGDPYEHQCRQTAKLLTDRLELASGDWKVSFQSRFGPEEWLRPYTDETLKTWGRQKLESVDVICPGFAADCLETLEEIEILNRGFFQDHGGGEFHYIKALNASLAHVEALAQIIGDHIEGW